MMYLKLNADYKQGELVPLLDDAIYVYCDVCKSLHRIENVSYAAFGTCSFEQLNACELCSEDLQEKDKKKQILHAFGWSPKVTLMMNDRLATIDEMISYIQHKGKNSLVENDSGEQIELM